MESNLVASDFQRNEMKRILIILLLITSLTAYSQIAKDKQYHFYAGATIGVIGTLTTDNDRLRPVYGIALATAAGIGKESMDMIGFGKPEWKDLGATVVGGVVSVGIVTGIRTIIKKVKRNKQYKTVK